MMQDDNFEYQEGSGMAKEGCCNINKKGWFTV